MDKKIIIGLTAILLLGGAFWYYNSTKPVIEENQMNTESVQNDITTEQINDQQSPPIEATEATSIQEIMIRGSNFKFEPTQIRVKLGDTVRVRFMNTQGTHNFTIDGLNVATKTLSAGAEETIEFTATETGEFEYYCSVGNHKDQGMKGALVVEQ